MNLDCKIKNLVGPILIIGASGFIGANILRRCLKSRKDVVGTFFSGDSWRLFDIPVVNTSFLNLQDPLSVLSIFNRLKPKTVFDCSSFGAYSFERDFDRIHAINYLSFIRVMEEIAEFDLSAYIHAGSSSEYGKNASGPAENDFLIPDSHYAVSKAATSQAIAYYGKVRRFPVVNLRLYSVYGPFEDSSRLIPVLCKNSLEGKLPIFAGQNIGRDFIHVDDVISAFVDASIAMCPKIAGESFNIGTGAQTTFTSLATLSKKLFSIQAEPEFSSSVGRAWDVDNWYANPKKAEDILGWTAKVSLEEGLISTRDWWKIYLNNSDFFKLTKQQHSCKEKNSVSAIVACFKDEKAIPIMYSRLVSVFNRLGLDYEIIFVNDNSPDNSVEIIREITARDRKVIGISHSRNFGSQSAFRSGMELASKESCVLLDGDLQDPPELIESFVNIWRDGADVVYGRRIKRQMPRILESCYRGFYRLFAAMSEVPIPKDAGDFSLMDRTVVYWMLKCEERDAFLRGLRAYVGFTQVGVDYIRPERMFGVSNNNWLKNIGWAKKGIFSFSRMPLHMLTAFGGIALVGSLILSIAITAIRFVSSDSTPKGITFLSLLIMLFGSAIIFGIGLLGEYIGKIFEETKARPPFIRRNLIIGGEVKLAEFQRRHK